MRSVVAKHVPRSSPSIGYPRTKASGESSTTKHRLLHASGPHPIPPPNDPNRVGKRVKVRHLSCRVSMTFRVVRTNQYNQDLELIHSTNGNHLESPNEGSSIDHQVTIHLHAQNITMFPTNETWYFASQMLVSSSGGLILILTAQSTRNEFRMHTGLSSSAEHDVVTNDIITNPSADLAILLVDLLITMTSLMTLSSLVPDSLELAADS
ncbi:hypothetical protein F511_38870 [Dorcoceras hygrometricum]|uniref:Uncharacterized protein n=1 Tax=Dorcoceras hygrometricum TaxID=472368 RepID=A0A2Z7DGM5_9LAMI|nr:hypothetical protein F511_38870 [Dorcoceras hygrometricum]